MANIRCFIAVSLPADVREYLNQFRFELAAAIPNKAVRWVPTGNIHLTLRFLGDTDERLLPAIISEMEQLGESQEPFDLQLGRLGCFPNERRPRVLWVDVVGHLEGLETLHATLERSLTPLGWDPEKRSFHPHLTIGRVKDSRRVAAARLEWGRPLEPINIPVTQIHLIESRLFPDGAVYETRHTSRLMKEG